MVPRTYRARGGGARPPQPAETSSSAAHSPSVRRARLGADRGAANAAAISSASATSRPLGDQRARRRPGEAVGRHAPQQRAAAGWRARSGRTAPGRRGAGRSGGRRPSTPLTRAFSRVASTRERVVVDAERPAPTRAWRPRSRGRRSRSRRRRAARAGSSASSSSRHSRVVACAPVPNAWPGSMTTSTGATSALTSGVPRRPHVQRGRRRSTGRGTRASGPPSRRRPRSSTTSTSAPPAAARRSGSSGSSPGAP